MDKGGKAAILERYQGNTNHMHHAIQELMKNFGFITLSLLNLALCLTLNKIMPNAINCSMKS